MSFALSSRKRRREECTVDVSNIISAKQMVVDFTIVCVSLQLTQDDSDGEAGHTSIFSTQSTGVRRKR